MCFLFQNLVKTQLKSIDAFYAFTDVNIWKLCRGTLHNDNAYLDFSTHFQVRCASHHLTFNYLLDECIWYSLHWNFSLACFIQCIKADCMQGWFRLTQILKGRAQTPPCPGSHSPWRPVRQSSGPPRPRHHPARGSSSQPASKLNVRPLTSEPTSTSQPVVYDECFYCAWQPIPDSVCVQARLTRSSAATRKAPTGRVDLKNITKRR